MNHSKLFNLILLGSVFLFFSCNEDDAPEKETPENEVQSGNVYTLTVSEEYDDRFEFVAFITDETGEVLDEGKIKPGESLKLYAPEDYTGQVDFHYANQVTLTSAFNYFVYTKPDVPSGWETILTVGEPVDSPTNTHSVQVFDIPTEYETMRHAGPTVWQQSSYVLNDPQGGYQLFYSNYESGPITYILQTANSGSPRYFHFNEPYEDGGYTEQVDFTDFIPVDGINFEIGTQASQITAGIAALFAGGKTSGLGTSIFSNTDNIDLYYYPAEIFPAYVTTIEAVINNVAYTYRKYGDRIAEMRWLDAEITSLNISGNTLTASTTGSYDEFFVFGDNQWDIGDKYYYYFWRIDMKGQPSQSVILPDIIQILGKHWAGISGATITPETGEVNSSSVVNYLGEFLSVSRAVD